MDAVEFLREYNRMESSDHKAYNELGNIMSNEALVEFVERWSEEHRQKTRLQDFCEKFPHVEIDKCFYTHVCCQHLGYCECKYTRAGDCEKCWHEPV